MGEFLKDDGERAKCFTCQGYGMGPCSNCKGSGEEPFRVEEKLLPGILACPEAKRLVQALLQDFDTIKFNHPDPKNDIWKLYDAFKDCACSNYCKPKAMTPGRRLIER